MTIDILDYKDRIRKVDVGELDEIKKMFVNVVTGDEILTVEYNNGSSVDFDSSDDRRRDFYDGNYTIYDKETGTNILEDQGWLTRDHYDYLYEHGDCSEADMSDWW
jgi:hypothetical protein